MNKKLLVALISTFLILSILPTAFAAQPPVDPDTIYVGTIGQPNRLGPMDAYDTASAEVIMNVYDTLLAFKRNLTVPWPAAQQPDPRTQGLVGEFEGSAATGLPTVTVITLDITALGPINPSEPNCTSWEKTGGGAFYHMNRWKDNRADGVIGVDDVIYVEQVVAPGPPYTWIPCTKYTWQIVSIVMGPPMHIIAERVVYTFELRTGMKIHDWIDQTGTLHHGEVITTADVEYSFEMGLVVDRLYGPMWMLYKPLFDVMNADEFWGSLAERIDLGKLIMCAIQSNATHVWISTGIKFPNIAWYQILSQTWSSIVPKAFALDHQCWNGTFFDNVVNPTQAIYSGWRRWPIISRGPLSRAPTVKSPYDATPWVHNFDPAPTARGSGPYMFTYWHTATLEVRWDWFPDYWKGWTDIDNAHPYHAKTIIETGVADWPTRKLMFLAGDFDTCAVPRANMRELLIPPAYADPLPGLVSQPFIPTLSSDSVHYQQNIAAGSPYMPKIGGVDAPTIFNDPDARKAFSYTINFTELLADAWFNEAFQPATWHIANLAPDYRDPSIVPYDLDMAKVKTHLQAATVNGTSLWDSGFTMTILYNEGNDQRRIVCEIMKNNLESLNAERPGPDIQITITAIDWNAYLDAMELNELPFFEIGWLADFADVDNWARPYMHSAGDFSYIQGYGNSTIDEIIDLAVKTPNGPARQAMYYQLQHIFIDDCPTLMIVQPLGRAWYRNWYQGWYYNALFPGTPWYDRWKGYTGDLNRDMVVDIFDLVIVAAEFGNGPVPPIVDLRADVNKDGTVDVFDLVIIAAQFGSGS